MEHSCEGISMLTQFGLEFPRSWQEGSRVWTPVGLPCLPCLTRVSHHWRPPLGRRTWRIRRKSLSTWRQRSKRATSLRLPAGNRTDNGRTLQHSNLNQIRNQLLNDVLWVEQLFEVSDLWDSLRCRHFQQKFSGNHSVNWTKDPFTGLGAILQELESAKEKYVKLHARAEEVQSVHSTPFTSFFWQGVWVLFFIGEFGL